MTNVGNAKAVYVASVEVPATLSVTVTPARLRFTKVNQVQAFTVTVRSKNGPLKKRITEGHLMWVSGKHVVRSPILVSSKKFFQKKNTTSSTDQHTAG